MRLLKVFLILSTTLIFIQLITRDNDDGVPRFDDNPIPTILQNDSAVFDTQNTAILNLKNEPNFSSPIKQNTIVKSMQFLNEHHKILNVEEFGQLNEKTVSSVIVVQVCFSNLSQFQSFFRCIIDSNIFPF